MDDYRVEGGSDVIEPKEPKRQIRNLTNGFSLVSYKVEAMTTLKVQWSSHSENPDRDPYPRDDGKRV